MLTHLLDSGHLRYVCKCGSPNEVHVSHADVRFHLPPGRPKEHRTVGLPPCDCGAQMFLKVDFTPDELAHLSTHDADPDRMRDGIPTTRSQEAAQRHIKLAQLMEDMGKPLPQAPAPLPAPGDEVPQGAVKVEVDHQALLDALQAEGIPATSLADFATWLKAISVARGSMTTETPVAAEALGEAFSALES